MYKKRGVKLTILVLTLSCAGDLVSGVAVSKARAWLQPQDKTIEHQSPPTQPVKVVGVNVAGKLIKPGEVFDAPDGEWIKNASFKLKNISGKPIAYVGMLYAFPETKASGNTMAFPINFGRRPNTPNAVGEPQRLLPDEAMDIRLSEQQFEKLRAFIERRHPMTDIRKARVEIQEVFFEDGIVWSLGSFYRQDPDNPLKLIPVTKVGRQSIPQSN